jgi:hypothetical protein
MVRMALRVRSSFFHCYEYADRAIDLLQGPWIQTEQQIRHRREFKYAVQLEGKTKEVVDTQMIDVFNDHLCYVITERRTPWSLPAAKDFSIVSKIVVTHVAKSKCKFAIYAKVEWRKRPLLMRKLVEKQALADAGLLARSLTDILIDQVAMLGSSAYNNSRKAVQIFGNVGQSKDVLQPVLSGLPTSSRDRIRPHTRPNLVLCAAKATAVNTLLAVLGALIYLSQATAKVASAHHVLVLILAFSGITNFYFANKDTWGWYRDRQAKKFMKGIGVHTMTGLGHSVWLKDLDVLSVPPLTMMSDANITDAPEGRRHSPCRQNFNALLAQTDPASPPLTSRPTQDSDSKTLSRLQRTRHNFGTYRHDLLVALRVIERVEKETITAEWESWVSNEVGRCKATKRLIDEGAESGVKEWWRNYCGSCEGENKVVA